MCIILYAPSGVEISKRQLENAFEFNPDGAGVMTYNTKGEVLYRKGFMNFDSLWHYWHRLPSNTARAVHCRIATSGKVGGGCCHPFPIVDNLEAMTAVKGIGVNGCLMHNGIFSEYTPKDGMKSSYSDTMFYTKDLIYPLLPVIDNSSVIKLLSKMSSRVLLFLPNQKIYRFGTWEEDPAGFYASNDTYDYGYGYGYGKTYWYYLKFKSTSEDDALQEADNFCARFSYSILDESLIMETFESIGDGLYGFGVETYYDITKGIPENFKIEEFDYYPKNDKVYKVNNGTHTQEVYTTYSSCDNPYDFDDGFKVYCK